MKDVSRLTAVDLREHPVWKFTGTDSPGEQFVRPVKKLPLSSLAACLVGTEITLSSGKKRLGLIGNVDVTNPRLTEHFVTLSIYRDDGEVFHLARYHDFDFAERGPAQLAAFLRIAKNEVFPITWDVSQYASGVIDALRGSVSENPRQRLTRAEIIALAVP